MGSAAWSELAFLIPAIIGFLVNWFMFNASVSVKHHLEALGLNGARSIVAQGSVRSDGINMGIQFAFMALGFLLVMLPPTNPQQPVTVPGIAVAVVIIGAEIALVVKSVLNRRDRHRLIAILSRKDAP